VRSILICVLCIGLWIGVSACTIPAKEQDTTKSEQTTPEETTTKTPEETTTKAPEDNPSQPPTEQLPSYDGSGFPNHPSDDGETKRY
jgi:hypothetical protein